MTQILFDGLTFDDTASTGFTISSWTGWWDGAPSKTSLEERSSGDGAHQVSAIYRGARTITVEGSYVGTTMEDTYAALLKLAALQADGRPSVFRTVEPFSDLQATVALVGAPLLPNQLAFPFFTYKFDVTAADPYRYGVAQSTSAGAPSSGGGLLFPLGTTSTKYWDFGADGTSGRVNVTNPGTAATYLLLTVTGGMDGGFVITDVTTGVVVPFSRAIPVGSAVTINERTGRAWIDDPANDVSGFLVAPDAVIRVGPGETHVLQFAPIGVVTGAPTFTAQWSPAYL